MQNIKSLCLVAISVSFVIIAYSQYQLACSNWQSLEVAKQNVAVQMIQQSRLTGFKYQELIFENVLEGKALAMIYKGTGNE